MCRVQKLVICSTIMQYKSRMILLFKIWDVVQGHSQLLMNVEHTRGGGGGITPSCWSLGGVFGVCLYHLLCPCSEFLQILLNIFSVAGVF